MYQKYAKILSNFGKILKLILNFIQKITLVGSCDECPSRPEQTALATYRSLIMYSSSQ